MTETSKFEGERISKRMARAGLCSRREAERWINAGRVKINGIKIRDPAINVVESDKIAIDGKAIPNKPNTRLWRYNKPLGLITTHSDEKGRETVFDALPPEIPRVVSIGRLDLNTEGLLLLTNNGELAGHLEHPKTGWIRKYRVRVFGEVTGDKLRTLKKGVTYEGVTYKSISAKLENETGDNAWLMVSLSEGKNREVRNAMEAVGLTVNRLIRVSYGPFQLGNLASGAVEEVTGKAIKASIDKQYI